MEEFKTSLAAAKRLRNYLSGEYKAPIVLKDGSSFEWREFVVVPFDRKQRKDFIVSYEANIHNTMPENLLQSFRDTHYTVALILNSDPLLKVWIDMSVDVFMSRAGIKIDLSSFE
jgi:hypothetical protein